MKIPIIFENEDILIIDKPAGILVHPVPISADSAFVATLTKETASADKKDEKNTLIDILKQKYPNAQLVHRLDRDTSGLMVIAKNEKISEWLKEQFEKKTIKKKYLALVVGRMKDTKGIITKTISKSRKRGGSQTTTPIRKRREAITRYEVLKEFKNYTLLEVSPETGRTHQIRIHLASIGHPIAGDEKYKFKRQEKIEGLNRQFLHSRYLQIPMPDGSIKEFQFELPEELNKILKII